MLTNIMKDGRDKKRKIDQKNKRKYVKASYRDNRGYNKNGHSIRRRMVRDQKMREDMYVETRYFSRGGGRNYWDCGKERLVIKKRIW